MSDEGDKPAGGDAAITDQPAAVAPGVVPGVTPQQLEQMMQAQFQALVIEISSMLQVFAPHLGEPEAAQLAQAVAKEQMDQTQVPMIIRSMISPDAVAKHPTIHLWVADSKGLKVELKAPKRLENIKDLMTVAQSTILLAFLLAPGARAVLRAFGFRYTLAQSQTPAGGRVILSS